MMAQRQVYASAMAADSEAIASYNPGDLTVQTTINVIFEMQAE
jgi:uncharacterized protein YggE